MAQTADTDQTKGDVYFADKNYQQALQSFSKAISEGIKDNNKLAIIYFTRALCYENLKQPDMAIEDYSKVISLNPQYRNAYWNRGVLYDRKESFQAALDDYTKAIALTQDNNSLLILYCNVAYDNAKLNQPQRALAADSTAMLLNPGYSRAYTLKGMIHLSLKKYPQAIDDYTTAINTDDRSNIKRLAYCYIDRADAKSKNNQLKDAINDYSYAINLDPQNGHAYWNRGGTYNKHGDYELVTSDYTKAMEFFAGNNIYLSKLYEDRSRNESGQSLLSLAIKDDSTAIALDPKNYLAYFSLAAVYTQNGDYQQGIDIYKKTLKIEKNTDTLNGDLYFFIANDEYFLNEFDKVISDCSMAITLNPDNFSAYFYRGKVYLKKLNKKEEATNDFNKVLSLDTSKKSVDYIFSLFYTGNSDMAIAILQQSILNTTDNSRLLNDYYNMACLYSLMNKPDEANNNLKIAIDKGYSKKFIMADEDLDNIRNTDDYKNIMAGSSK